MKVTHHEFPFWVTFNYKERWFGCGGALITQRHVLSCQHCFGGEAMTKEDKVEVVFGKTRRDDEGIVKRNVSRIVFHPVLDFAILVLDQEVPLSNNVKMIGLSEKGSDFSGKLATLIGSV